MKIAFTAKCSMKASMFEAQPPHNLPGIPRNYGHLTLSMVESSIPTKQGIINLSTEDHKLFEALEEGEEYDIQIHIKPRRSKK